jgi:hypothetical protein
MNYSTAYRIAYDAAGMIPAAVHVAASRLASDAKVELRIAALAEDVAERLTSGIALTAETVIQEARVNLLGARADGNWPAANGALSIAAGASGVTTSASRVESVGRLDVVHRLDAASDAVLEQLIGLAPTALPPSTEIDAEPVTVEGTATLIEDSAQAWSEPGDGEPEP